MSDAFVAFLRGENSTISDIAEITHVSKATVHQWVRQGKLKAAREGRRLVIRYDDNQDFVRRQFEKYWKKPAAAFVPKEIKRYGRWHELLDELTWLLKVSYSTPEEIKKKQFRLDQLFANFLKFHKVSIHKVKRALSSLARPDKRLIIDDLKRGWYNELAYSLPLKTSTLGLSFKDIECNKQSATERFSFPSWRITTAYYSAYFFLRSITLQKQANLRLQEHSATITSFKNNVLGPLSRVIWKSPFDIRYTPKTRFTQTELLIRQIPHLKNAYCLHPRPPQRSPSQLCEHIFRTFRSRGRKKEKPFSYTIFDYLHDFRVWANYLEIDNLLSLWGGGYKSFLDQNLSIILFFLGGIAELCFIALLGDKEYGKSLQNFYALMVSNDALAESELPYIPHYQRLVVYRSLGFTKFDIARVKPDNNAVQLY